MIKKFEEFVNENLYQNRRFENNKHEIVKYLSSLGVNQEDCKDIYNVMQNSDKAIVSLYDINEIEEILKRVPGCDTIEGIVDFMKNVFFIKPESNRNRDGSYTTIDLFYDWVEKHGVKREECPVVRGYKNKLLTGDVIWCDNYGTYYENEDDIIDSLYDNAANETLDDYMEDWVNNEFENLDTEEINLDKECGWIDSGEWLKK
jgi:hypothetical protein